MTNKNYTLAEKLYFAKKEWARLDRVASQPEETKKSTLGMLVEHFKSQDTKMSIAMAEYKAYASEEYKTHIQEMAKAREMSHIKFAEVEGIREALKEIDRQNMQNAMQLKYGNGIGD